MRAVIQPAYGGPDVLMPGDVDVPVARADQVLVRVRAAGLNIGDWHLLRGIPYAVRLASGVRRPRNRITGMDHVLVGVKDMGRWLGVARQIKALSTSPFVRRKMRLFVCKHTRADLAVLKQLVETGDVRPVIDERFDLARTGEAFATLGRGHVSGKVVLTVE